MKAALFDLDGVIFDTESQYSIFWGMISRRYHPEIPNLEYIIKGSTLTQIFDGYFADVKDQQDTIIQELNEFELKMSFDWIPGVLDYIKELHRRGIKTAIVTSSNVPKMNSVRLQHSDFDTLFDAVLTSEDFEYSKPHPDCYLKAAARLGIDPSECVVFEDSFNGLKSGRAANMYVVGLATTNPADAIAPYADIVVKDFTNSPLLTIPNLPQ